MTQLAYEQKKLALSEQLRRNREGVRLQKATSNLFRSRQRPASTRLDVSALDQVVAVDPAARTVEVEGMTTYEKLTDAC